MKSAPFDNAIEASRPIPELPPVTIATLFAKRAPWLEPFVADIFLRVPSQKVDVII